LSGQAYCESWTAEIRRFANSDLEEQTPSQNT
jgi:hypothetical protein